MQKLFAHKVRTLREVRGISQSELGRRLGHAGKGYVHDVERGAFVPPGDKRKLYAKALGVSADLIEDIVLEAKIIELGVREPGFVSMFKDYHRLSRRDRLAIIRTYREIKKRKDGADRP